MSMCNHWGGELGAGALRVPRVDCQTLVGGAVEKAGKDHGKWL
eukprot:CAMPEP_0171077802 /NCGR_PEP_ID=MMETSP0766_2-20121228/14265_1 /TAXON_ID=439317 /ORGANISM="Gambierdiscus australes, Strain CAWD 149" /LENGTH=42 /DNA_ID= /DNA_START= /DNA_END= /DNA_ORIENTATION=